MSVYTLFKFEKRDEYRIITNYWMKKTNIVCNLNPLTYHIKFWKNTCGLTFHRSIKFWNNTCQMLCKIWKNGLWLTLYDNTKDFG